LKKFTEGRQTPSDGNSSHRRAKKAKEISQFIAELFFEWKGYFVSILPLISIICHYKFICTVELMQSGTRVFRQHVTSDNNLWPQSISV
jgi:hypothetical protein